VAFARGGCEVVQPVDLVGAQFELVGGGVFFDAGDPADSRDCVG
jgi:hypothetical protein